ncbi:hypothetical protein [Actinomyces johnsonii]|uniref:variant leucine-rich repeat-containing protein n=1 Tax=Actinomyces johnsonii TaxID=544581 RepID=UPI0028D1AA62|nr:hypothetical protein [Actinomyces johnsonii]
MDPVQLMMAAHQADEALAAQTPDQSLQAAIAQSRPDLWAALSRNPAAYPDLLSWLASTGNVEVIANLRARGFLPADAVAPGVPADEPGPAVDANTAVVPEENPESGTSPAEQQDAGAAGGGAPSTEGEQLQADDEAETQVGEAETQTAEVSSDESPSDETSPDEEETEAGAGLAGATEEDTQSGEQPEEEAPGAAVDEVAAEDQRSADDGGAASGAAADGDAAGTVEPSDETPADGPQTVTASEDTPFVAPAPAETEAFGVAAAQAPGAAAPSVEAGAVPGAAPMTAPATPAAPAAPPPVFDYAATQPAAPGGAPAGPASAPPPGALPDISGSQAPPPGKPSRSRRPILVVLVVVLLLAVGGGGVWAWKHFAGGNRDSGSNARNDATGADQDKQSKPKADQTASATALPSGEIKACSDMPTLNVTSVEDGQGQLQVKADVKTSCAEGDFLAGSSNRILIYSPTAPTGGSDVDHLVASGTFDFSASPLIIPGGGRTVTLSFGEQHYFRTAKDIDVKDLKVTPSFDRGSQPSVAPDKSKASSSSSASPSSSTSPATVSASSASDPSQDEQDEKAAEEALQWQSKHDRPLIMSKYLGKWTPQLSSKKAGLVADGKTWTNRSILADFLKVRQTNPDAALVFSDDWSVFDAGGSWWVVLSGELYGTAEEANAWCDTQGYDADHCYAKRMESSGPSTGTTKTR